MQPDTLIILLALAVIAGVAIDWARSVIGGGR